MLSLTPTHLTSLTLSALSLALGAGCVSPQHGGGLSDYSGATLDVTTFGGGGQAMVDAALLPDLARELDCTLLTSSVTSTIDGAPMTASSLGGSDPQPQGGLGGCFNPSFDGAAPAGASGATVVLSDSSATVTMTVPDLFTAPAIAMVSPGTVAPGDTVVFSVTPATDSVHDGTVWFSGDPSALFDLPLVFEGNTARFVVPKDAPAMMTTASVSLSTRALVTRCDGVAACTAERSPQGDFPLQILAAK
jgi:hypothetical protein